MVDDESLIAYPFLDLTRSGWAWRFEHSYFFSGGRRYRLLDYTGFGSAALCFPDCIYLLLRYFGILAIYTGRILSSICAMAWLGSRPFLIPSFAYLARFSLYTFRADVWVGGVLRIYLIDWPAGLLTCDELDDGDGCGIPWD